MEKTCEKLTLFFIWDIMKIFLNCNYPSCWLLDSAVQILGRIKLSYEFVFFSRFSESASSKYDIKKGIFSMT